MLGKAAFAFICISFSRFVLGDDLESSALCELVHSGDVTYETYSPINVNTTNVISVPGTAVFKNSSLKDDLDLVTYGYNFEVYILSRFHFKFYGITIQVCDQYYKFYKMIFYANPSLGRSFNTIDGKGTPLTARLLYFNLKYGSFEESFEHRDGLFAIDYMMDFSEEGSGSFYQIQETMEILRTFSNYPFQRSVFNMWFKRVSAAHEYYAFLGSYMDPKTGTQYQSVINILAKKVILALDEEQFVEAFGGLRNRDGGTQNSTQPLNPSNGRKIYGGQEISEASTLY